MRYRIQHNPALGKYKVQVKNWWDLWWVDFGKEEVSFTAGSGTPYLYTEPFLFDTEDAAKEVAIKLCYPDPEIKDEWKTVKKYTDYAPR